MYQVMKTYYVLKFHVEMYPELNNVRHEDVSCT